MEIQTSAPILMTFCMHIPTYPRKVLVHRFDLWRVPPWGLEGLKYLKLKDTFLKTVYETKDVRLVDNLPGQ